MKTKLLLSIFLFVSAFGFAQVQWTTQPANNITSNSARLSVSYFGCNSGTNVNLIVSTSSTFSSIFASPSFPNSPTPGSTIHELTGLEPETTYYFYFYGEGVMPCSQVTIFGGTQSFTTLPIPVISAPSLSTPTVSVTTGTANISFTIFFNNASTTSSIRYGLSTTNLSNTVAGPTATSNLNATVLLTNLMPNTQYFYAIDLLSNGGSTSMSALTFTTLDPADLVTVAEFDFDNSLQSVSGDSQFANNSNLSFVEDRFGNPNRALRMANGGTTTASITGLPNGSSSRSISLWIRPTTVNADNVLFTYGASSQNRVYGGSFTPTNIFNFTYQSNIGFATPTVANVWKHIVFTHQQTPSMTRIYVDGVLVNSANNLGFDTNEGLIFHLGSLFGQSSPYVGAFDDLKIFDSALTADQVGFLFEEINLSSADFQQNNLEVALYPNPVNNILNIELVNQIQSVEIYSLQGQKILTSNQNQINVESLSSGIYLVRIVDNFNRDITKKIVVE